MCLPCGRYYRLHQTDRPRDTMDQGMDQGGMDEGYDIEGMETGSTGPGSGSGQPSPFPLQAQPPKHDYKLTDPHAKLSDLWLHSQYQNLSIHRENRKRNIDEEVESCDEMIISDTEMNTTLVSQNSVTKENVHPPKRRLMSILSPVFGQDESTDEAHGPSGASGPAVSGATGTGTGPNVSSAVSNAVSSNGPTGTVTGPVSSTVPGSRGAQTPPDDTLPLPSPSASPIHTKQDMTDPMETLLSSAPTTQHELIALIQNLSAFLTERNQNHVIFKLLQNVNRSSLSSLHDAMGHSLRRDLLSNLPTEITCNIFSQLDYKSLSNISLVSRNWYKMLNNSNVWIELLKKDRLMESQDEIDAELASPQALIEEWSDPSYKGRINVSQLLYKKRSVIYNRWMDPAYEPKRISIRVPSQGNNVVTCLQHDEDKIITGVDDRLISVYSTKTGELLKVLKGHEGGVWALKYTGNTLISGSTDRTVRVWNIKTGKCTHIFRGHTSTVRCLDILHPVVIGKDDGGEDIVFPKEPLLVTGSRDHNLNVWKLPLADETDEEPGTDSVPSSVPGSSGTSQSRGPDAPDSVPSSGSSDEAITYDSNDPHNPYLLAVLLGHTQSVRSVSAYGNLIVSGSYDATVRVWDILDNFSCKQVLTGHTDRIYSTVLDYHNKICYSGSMDLTVHVWNVETGELLHTLEGHASLVGLLELSKDYLVSAAADSTLRVWNPSTGENYSKLEGHTAAITCFQHDPLRIVSGSERMLKLWNIKTGKFVKDILADVTGGIWQVRFDYKRCVAAVQRSINDREETFIEILDYSEP